MQRFFFDFGHWIVRRRWVLIASWIVMLIIGGLGAQRLPDALLGGSGAIAGSASQRMDQVLHAEFQNPFTRLLIVTFHSEGRTLDDPEFKGWVRDAAAQLRGLDIVSRVTSYLDDEDARLRSSDGKRTLLMVGLKAASVQEEEQAVPVVREALRNLRIRLEREDPSTRLAVTGHAAITYDINQHNKRDGEEAEAMALPLTLLILVLAFGALVASGLPLIIGVAATTLTMGLAFLIAQVTPLSNLVQNIITMIGLAVGIDYSLLMVSRFREALAERPEAEAICHTLARVGPAVVYSGLTVMIGLLGLFFSPLMEMQSIAIGGSLVVVVSVLAALTLLPAVMAVLGRRIDAPRWLSRPLRNMRAESRWKRLAETIMKRPLPILAVSGAIALALAWPATRLNPGFPTSNWLPASMEARQGLDVLETLDNRNAVIPLYLVIRSTDGKAIVDPTHLPELMRFAGRLKQDARVGEVLSPVTLRQDLGLFQYLMLYRDLDRAIAQFPLIGELFLSKDRSAALFQVIPASSLAVKDAQALARDIAKDRLNGPFRLEVGGQPVYYNDFNDSLTASYPLVFGFVIGVTALVLMVAFRSLLIPIKAILMNLLSVAAGYGAVVAIFQLGWLKGLVGLSQTVDAIPLTIPMMVFCIVFGLSMDYEVFLLSRIKEEFDRTGDNRQATAEGLATTGAVITSAALIMGVVFGAFAWAEIVIIKMMGVGLATAVLVDATLIRALMMPALMRLAGRWNWWPGDRHVVPHPFSYTATKVED